MTDLIKKKVKNSCFDKKKSVLDKKKLKLDKKTAISAS
jgi:hypothetical protein